MMGKFSPQLKELPGSVDVAGGSQREISSERPTTMKVPAVTGNEEDHLRFAQAALEREVLRTDLPPNEAEALREVLFGLRERNVQRIGLVWRGAFAEFTSPSENVRAAYDHLERYFGKTP